MSDYNNKLIVSLFEERDALRQDVVRLTLKVAEMYEGAEEQRQRIKRLEEFVDQLTNPKFTRDDLPKEALLQRIKRLEEAGQRVEDAAYSVQDWSGTALGDALDELNKAKEAKP